jgi:DNA processing protein
MSSSVIIVETDLKGGAMHTARFCLEEQKPLGCMAYADTHPNPMTEGNKYLVERGDAAKLSSVDDALAFAESALTR